MMEVLQRGSATRLPALAILRAIFEVRPAHCPSLLQTCLVALMTLVWRMYTRLQSLTAPPSLSNL